MRNVLIFLCLFMLACGAADAKDDTTPDKADPKTSEYFDQITEGLKENNGEVDAATCLTVDEAITHLRSTTGFKEEQVKLEQERARIEREESGLAGRMQQLQQLMVSGDFPHTMTLNLWKAAERECIDAGHLPVN